VLLEQRQGVAIRSIVRHMRVPLLVGTLLAMTTMGTAQAHDCHETVNPAANPAVGDNGYPDDPFHGDAVPGGSSTTPGTTVNGPINPDGFYLVRGYLFSDNTPILYPGPPTGYGEGPYFWPTTTIKYTEWGRSDIRITDNIGGPRSAITYHVSAPGDLYVENSKDNNGKFCGVPPPPF